MLGNPPEACYDAQSRCDRGLLGPCRRAAVYGMGDGGRMTVDVEQSAQGPRAAQPNGNGNSGSPVGSPAVRYSTARHGQHVEESPDLLRWRADLLMDEMMMGGVDVSSADAAPRTFGGVEPSERMAPRPLEERPDPRRYPDTERDPNRFRGQADAPSGRPPMTDARAGYPNPTTAADAEPRARPRSGCARRAARTRRARPAAGTPRCPSSRCGARSRRRGPRSASSRARRRRGR